MDHMRKLLDDLDSIVAAQKTYDGKKRNDLKNSDFLFPETRSFPIVSPADVKDAISNYGRMSGKMTYDAFLSKLYSLCKRKGPEFVAALPQASKDKLGIKSKSDDMNMVENEDDSMLEEESETLDMVIAALRNIHSSIASILNNIDLDRVKENLTEPWVLGTIAVIEDNVKNIHDFVKFTGVTDDNTTQAGLSLVCDNCGSINEVGDETIMDEGYFTCAVCQTKSTIASKSRPGLWENIRKKKEREGKNYKPAKPGDKDRPDPSQWDKLTDTDKKNK